MIFSMKYHYIATSGLKQLRQGTIDASTKEQAREQLEGEGLQVASIHAAGVPYERRRGLLGKTIGFGKTLHLEKIILAKQLAVMLRAGLSLAEALKSVAEQSTSKRMKEVIQSVTEMVLNGQPLAAGLEQFPKIFSGIFTGMVKVGEVSGTLERNLAYVSDELEKDYELRRKVRGALIYPAIVLSATVVLGIGMTIFILPKLVNMFSTFKLELPLMTRIFLGIANFLVDYGVYALATAVALVVGLRLLSRTAQCKPFFHQLILALPVFGKLSRSVNLARFSRSLSVLLKSGVPIVESLTMTAAAVDNVIFRNLILRTSEEIKTGKTMAVSFGESRYVPGIVVKMISVGERTGKLEDSLSYLSEYYSAEVDNTTKNLSTIIEPVLLIVIGVVLGFLAVAIISPIYQFTGSLQR